MLSQTKSNLGWHVIIRQPISIALAEVKSLQHKILALGFILSLLLLLLTYKLANKFSRPIELLADSAHAVEKGQEDIQFEAQTSIREIRGFISVVAKHDRYLAYSEASTSRCQCHT